MEIRIIAHSEYQLMLPLVMQLNPKTDPLILSSRLEAIKLPGYDCAGAFIDGKLIAICGMWIMAKIYIGKQMEIDNVAVDEEFRSQKIGNKLMEWVYNYAREQKCESVELNTYTGNHRSHKFYHNEGFKILGFHMQKVL